MMDRPDRDVESSVCGRSRFPSLRVALLVWAMVATSCADSEDPVTSPDSTSAPATVTSPDSTTTTTVEAAPVTSPNPPPAAIAAGSPEVQAVEYVAGFAAGGDDLLAHLLGAFATAGVPVVDVDGNNLVGPIDDVYGLPWSFVWTAAVPAKETRLSLIELAAGMGAFAPYEYAPGATAAELLDGLRDALVNGSPPDQFIARLVAASSLAAGGADPADQDATPDRILVDLPTAYLVTGAFVRAVFLTAIATELPAASPATSEARRGRPTEASGSDRARTLRRRDLRPRAAPANCSDDGMNGWAVYLASKAASGFSLPGKLDVPSIYKTIVDRAAVKGVIPESVVGTTDRVLKRAGFAMAAVNVLALLAAMMSLTGEARIDVVPLERNKRRSQGAGKSASVTAQVFYDYGKNGDEQSNAISCLLLMLTAAGSNASIPEEGPAEGVEIEFQPGRNMAPGFASGGLVMWGPGTVRLKQDTDSGGEAAIDVQGTPQTQDYPDDAQPVDEEFSIRLKAQVAPTTGSSIGQTFLDALFCAGPVFGGSVSSGDTEKLEALAGCVDYAVDVVKTMKFDLGEYVFALVDWASAWRIDHAYGEFHLAGTVCDLDTPFELTWTGPDSGGVVLVTPDGAGGGSFDLTGQLAGLSTSASGPIGIDADADPPTVFVGAGSWLVESPAGAISVGGAEDVTMPLIADAGQDCE